MITFMSLGERGRLGNQLFQYAALKSLGIKKNYEVKIPPPLSKEWHGQRCMLDQFNIYCSFLYDANFEDILYSYKEPYYITFDPNFFSIPDHLNIDRFFQSTLYFEGVEEEIKRELTPKDDLLLEGKEEIAKIKRDTGYNIVSLHLRRGDNTDQSNPCAELNDMYGKDGDFSIDSFYGIYLREAMKKFVGKRVRFLIFTGGARFSDDNHSDVEWCKRNLRGDDFLYSEGQSSMQDFCRIMSCDHNIISHVSSFGWWAAYQNTNNEKIVVAPKNYHPDHDNFTHRKGFYPKDWILV